MHVCMMWTCSYSYVVCSTAVFPLVFSVMSLVGIVKQLFKDPGLKQQYIFSAQFNTDPLENLFGNVWQSGG